MSGHAKYEVTLVFHKLYLAISFPCDVTISIKRGNKKFALKNHFPLDITKFKCDFKDSLISFPAVFSSDGRSFAVDKTTASLVLVTQKGNKNAGHFDIALSNILDNGQTESRDVKQLLEKCPDKKAAIVYSVKLTKVKDLTEEEFR